MIGYGCYMLYANVWFGQFLFFFCLFQILVYKEKKSTATANNCKEILQSIDNNFRDWIISYKKKQTNKLLFHWIWPELLNFVFDKKEKFFLFVCLCICQTFIFMSRSCSLIDDDDNDDGWLVVTTGILT